MKPPSRPSSQTSVASIYIYIYICTHPYHPLKLRDIKKLEEEVRLVETEYDRCNEAKVKGEMLGLCEEFPG